jgi:hypothetical protein
VWCGLHGWPWPSGTVRQDLGFQELEGGTTYFQLFTFGGSNFSVSRVTRIF